MIRNFFRRMFVRNVATTQQQGPTPGTTFADMDPRLVAYLTDTTYGDWRYQPLR